LFNKILVTGGTGFIGGYIIKELVEKGYAVRAIRRGNHQPFFIPEKIWEKVEWVHGDVLDTESLDQAMKGISAIIHSAAIISFLKKERKDMYEVNVQGTSNMVNLALENRISRFVHVSSIAAIGRTSSESKVNEEKKWQEGKINTYYSITKHKSEMEVWRGAAEGLNTVIINPSTVIGFGDWHRGSCVIFRNIYKEFPWYTTGINGFVDVEDVARSAVRLMESAIQDERFIISGENLVFRDFFRLIAAGFGKRPPHREATPFLSSLALQGDRFISFVSGKKRTLTKDAIKVAISKTYWDNEKILHILPGFSFTPISVCVQNACKNYVNSLSDGALTV